MSSQGGGDKIEQGRSVGELASGEVAVADEASVLLVVAHASPVVKALQREMDVFAGLEFKDGAAAIESAGEDVDHGAIGGSECGNLRIDEALIEAFVDGADVADDQRFQPALGAKAKDGIALNAVRPAVLGEPCHQLAEERLVGFVERVFGGPEAEGDHFVVAE